MKGVHILIAILSAVGVLVCGMFGWIVGASIGGNLTTGFIFQGLRGYEGTGMLGFYIGVALGFLIVSLALWRHQKNSRL